MSENHAEMSYFHSFAGFIRIIKAIVMSAIMTHVDMLFKDIGCDVIEVSRASSLLQSY